MSDDAERARHETLLRAVQRMVCEPGAERELRDDAGAWLAEAGLRGEDLEAMRAVSPSRLLVYRKLVRRALREAIRVEIPRTAARLGEDFARHVEQYLDETVPRSHYLRDAALEFLAWAEPRWASDSAVPAFAADLARHELVAFQVAAAEARAVTPAAPGAVPQELELDLDLDLPVRLDASATLVRYAHAVHRLLADEAARDEPEAGPTSLLVYRDAEHDVRYLELTPLAADILARLLSGGTLRAAVAEACAEHERGVTGEVLGGTAAVLEDLRARGVLLGADARRAP